MERADTREGMIELLSASRFDVVLSDYSLPAMTGLDALEVLREQGLDTPLILVTGTLGEESAVDCIKAGVTDYILKKNMARLAPAVERALKEVEQRRLRAEAERRRQEAEEQLRQVQRMEAIGRLAGGLAHDFHNILMVVRGHCEVLLKDLVPSDPRRKGAEQILGAADRAAELTKQLLGLSRKRPLRAR